MIRLSIAPSAAALSSPQKHCRDPYDGRKQSDENFPSKKRAVRNGGGSDKANYTYRPKPIGDSSPFSPRFDVNLDRKTQLR
jgi:hypothetical protein